MSTKLDYLQILLSYRVDKNKTTFFGKKKKEEKLHLALIV
jgi:hypothetical protein